MRATNLSLVFGFVATALAVPSHFYPGRHYKHHHESANASVSGMPYSLGNGTRTAALSGSSLHSYHWTSVMPIITPSPEVKAPEPTQTVASIKNQLAVDPTSDASDDCDACNACGVDDVVTVTYKPTITITVTAAASNMLPTLAISSATPVSPPPSKVPASSKVVAASVSSTPLSQTSASSLAEQAPSPTASGVQMAASSNIASASPSSASSIAASSSSAPASKAAFRTKRGILASGNTQQALVSALTPYSKIAWLGDWYSGAPNNLPPSMQFVPQNYGKQSDVKGEWTSNAKKAVAAGDKYFLSFGEPGTPNDQLHLEPQDAVTLFMQQMQPYEAQGVTIGAPGTLQNDQDFTWLSSFLDLCDKAGCNIGFLAAHWFWRADQAEAFKGTVTKFIALAKGKPVWVDNFQASGTAAAQKAFLQNVVPWLDAQAGVQAYAYVPVDPGTGQGFLNDDGKTLSDLGAFYGNL